MFNNVKFVFGNSAVDSLYDTWVDVKVELEMNDLAQRGKALQLLKDLVVGVEQKLAQTE